MKSNNIYFGFISLIIALVFSVNSYCSSGSEKDKVKVIIDFGNEKIIEKEISWKADMTALTALLYVADVSTHPIGEYVFVSSINNVQNIRGVKAWYYEVNGESPKVLAINNKINSSDTVSWIYKKDVCSNTVDNK